MPIYLVKSHQDDKIVDASSKSQAINHVVKNEYTAAVVTASDVVKLMQDGVVVEKAGEDLSQPTEAPVNRSADVVTMDSVKSFTSDSVVA